MKIKDKIIIALLLLICFGCAFFNVRNELEKKQEEKQEEVKTITAEVIKEVEKVNYKDTEEYKIEDVRMRKEHEEAKAKWLRDNPPVKELFLEGKMYDNEYIIEYLKENRIAGDCALTWIRDVVCVDSGKLRFPKERPNY